MGRLFGRCSNDLLSCERAITGTFNSLARDFNVLDISEISVALFSVLEPLTLTEDNQLLLILIFHKPM